MSTKPNNPKAPLATGTGKPAASGPAPVGKAFGTGEVPKMPSAMPARLPNKALVTETIATHTGKESLPTGGSSVTSEQGNADFGKGKTAAPISNNDVSGTHGPK